MSGHPAAGNGSGVWQDKLRRYAVAVVAYTVVVLLGAVGLVPDAVVLGAGLVLGLPLLLSWGAYQAHLELNPAVDAVARRRWRAAFFVLPPSMALYWWLHVRVS